MSGIFTKTAFESKTIIAAIVTLVASILALLGYTFTPEDQAVIVGIVTSLVTFAGAIAAIIGRIRATKAITRKGDI